jgi:hypothetical protein
MKWWCWAKDKDQWEGLIEADGGSTAMTWHGGACNCKCCCCSFVASLLEPELASVLTI